MSETMIPIPFRQLLDWIDSEYARHGSLFGVRRAYHAGEKTLPLFGGRLETPVGPAAGPNTQLAQNIIAAYFAGARFFELKTVQVIDGAELAACISRPCIHAEDEAYNCEWSTELTVPQAYAEYVKAWCAISYLSEKMGLGSRDGFLFNMSVGYDLKGIQSEKIDRYLNGMANAAEEEVFQDCIAELTRRYPEDADRIAGISPKISDSVTLSTLHGCPPDEIERIAVYLLREKGLHTFVKCNPTLLGYESARSILDGMGYDYVCFDDHHFREDLQYADAVPMFRRLQKLAHERGLTFGLKLSNTFPVEVKQNELPAEEMYMSGKALFPLTIEMASRLSRDFDGRLPLSYSGGADALNLERLFACGIFPITVATTILKPGGYQRLTQLAELSQKLPFSPFTRVDADSVAALSVEIRRDRHHQKALKPLPSRKSRQTVPLIDCDKAPCKGGCPIGQDIPEYIELCRKGEYEKALRVILEKNPLPFITGTICAHRCMNACTRNFYEDPVQIRATKLIAAERGYDAVLHSLHTPAPLPGKRAAIIGGGPTGMAAAFFLARAGVSVTLFEREAKLGGVVRSVIPSFRIPDEAIDKDASLLLAMGADVRLNTVAPDVDALKAEGYTHILFAVGASMPGRLEIDGNVQPVLPWMRAVKAGETAVRGNVCVVGGGNTAMDAARLALRAGAESASIVYRRTKKYMPADEEELRLALDEGVRFVELVSPVAQKNGKLKLQIMALGDPGADGRRNVVKTDKTCEIPCDLVISAIGEQVDPAALLASGIVPDESGRFPLVTNIPGVYVGGDAHRGPATVVEGIADAMEFTRAVLGELPAADLPAEAYAARERSFALRGVLAESAKCEGDRCLRCDVVCQNCADVCPNRANVVVELPDGRQEILHVDRMCNECGSCTAFCPYASSPFRDKFTLFYDRAGFDATPETSGFLPLGGKTVLVRLDGKTQQIDLAADNDLPKDLELLILTVLSDYIYLL